MKAICTSCGRTNFVPRRTRTSHPASPRRCECSGELVSLPELARRLGTEPYRLELADPELRLSELRRHGLIPEAA
jgi:hypothetical protein